MCETNPLSYGHTNGRSGGIFPEGFVSLARLMAMNRSRERLPSGQNRSELPATQIQVVGLLVAERARFHRFLVKRVGDPADADDLLQESLVRAFARADGLRRGERAMAWFYRILRRAVADHHRRLDAEERKAGALHNELRAHGDDVAAPPADQDAALCRCFTGVLPTLPHRYAEVLDRLELQQQPKPAVARALGISCPTLDVLLHRARRALRHRLEMFCGACSRESCLACVCAARDREKKPV
jgi:RNA polymerase sigma factor (sigma-70 family)